MSRDTTKSPEINDGREDESICTPYDKAPAASTLQCLPRNCTAICASKYKFPKGETKLTINCIDNKWVMDNPKYKTYKEIPGCEPICSPACANKGKCVAPNRCQCTRDWQGKHCRERACRQFPPMTRNAKRSCRPSQCTINCMPGGFKFKTLATRMNIQCKNGKWVSTTKNLALNSHCEPYCAKKCQNGGKCVAYNKCACPDDFRGDQCQHETENCSPKKSNFNGSFNCSGSETVMSCSLSCPEGVDFDFPPSSVYKCKFAEGNFTPSPLPKCMYGEGVEVVETRISPEVTKPEKLTHIQPSSSSSLCSEQCQNGGTCIHRNLCQCTQEFAGPQCQYPVSRCAPTNIGFNGAYRCAGTSDDMTCTLSCPEGIQFESPPAAAYKCEFATGVFTPSKAPKCVYGEGVQVIQRSNFHDDNVEEVACNPPCENGGSCVFHNMCQCPKNFRGPHCQYSVDRCSIKSAGFNGGFRCSGSSTEMSCTLSCPEGVDYEFPPAPSYKCKYETGKFTPSPIPNCVYGDDVEIIRVKH
ncbi:CLUMA_CG006977, isoform A [Clunio marinus]|uniref:CLUMA_CG006977, isoform A n=1 Tax=Clunio marinus TaxID=568069 RepID=A0A1J1I4Y8_9DIPT|nr:CLUMA_CG006977, isoform A [Clunio marinus]